MAGAMPQKYFSLAVMSRAGPVSLLVAPRMPSHLNLGPAMYPSLRPLLLLPFLVAPALAPAADAQPLADTLIAWRSYSYDREARVRVFRCPDDDRPHTVVVDDRADGAGGPVTDEASDANGTV